MFHLFNVTASMKASYFYQMGFSIFPVSAYFQQSYRSTKRFKYWSPPASMPYSLPILMHSFENTGHDKGLHYTWRCFRGIQIITNYKGLRSLSVRSLSTNQTPTHIHTHTHTDTSRHGHTFSELDLETELQLLCLTV